MARSVILQESCRNFAVQECVDVNKHVARKAGQASPASVGVSIVSSVLVVLLMLTTGRAAAAAAAAAATTTTATNFTTATGAGPGVVQVHKKEPSCLFDDSLPCLLFQEGMATAPGSGSAALTTHTHTHCCTDTCPILSHPSGNLGGAQEVRHWLYMYLAE